MKQLDKKYYIMAACSFVGVGLVAYLWLNKNQIFIENYNSNKDDNINDCKCNTPTNDGVIDCSCKIPVTIDPNKRPKKNEPNQAPPPPLPAINMNTIIKSQPSYEGIKYDAENNLIVQYNATSTNSLFNINNVNKLSSLPIYFMMVLYDKFYVYRLGETSSPTVSDAQRTNFNNYISSFERQMFEFNSKHITNIISIYKKVDVNKKLDYEEFKNIREYIISQFTPIIAFINVHIYAINQIKLAYNANNKSDFKNVENIQANIDTLISSYVTKMSDKKEGFVSYGNTPPSYSYYNFQSAPIIEAYEKATIIPSNYDIFTVLPSIEVSSDSNKTDIFYKDYTLNEIINFIILLIYDLKTIQEKTLNINETVNNNFNKERKMGERSGSVAVTIDDNMIKIAYRDVYYGFIRMMNENMRILLDEIFKIVYSKKNKESLREVSELNIQNKLIIAAINKFFVNMNEVIDLINILKEFWKEPETNKLREISNDEIFNFLKGGDGLLMKINKNEMKEMEQNYPRDPRRK